MAFPSFFIIFLIIIFIIQHHLRKSRRLEETKKQAFWQQEQQSLSVRKKEFSKTDYIYPDLTQFDFALLNLLDPSIKIQLKQIESDLQRLAKLDMMNFTHMTNSEIRITFGTANQTVIQSNEEHFDLFLKTLAKYAHLMSDQEEYNEAILAFEHCIDLGSEYHDHYLSLATLYEKAHKKEALHHLIEKASSLNSLNKQALVKKLNSYLS